MRFFSGFNPSLTRASNRYLVHHYSFFRPFRYHLISTSFTCTLLLALWCPNSPLPSSLHSSPSLFRSSEPGPPALAFAFLPNGSLALRPCICPKLTLDGPSILVPRRLPFSSQFKAQEPGTDDEVLQFCQLNYGVTFPIAKKVSPFPSTNPRLFR